MRLDTKESDIGKICNTSILYRSMGTKFLKKKKVHVMFSNNNKININIYAYIYVQNNVKGITMIKLMKRPLNYLIAMYSTSVQQNFPGMD